MPSTLPFPSCLCPISMLGHLGHPVVSKSLILIAELWPSDRQTLDKWFCLCRPLMRDAYCRIRERTNVPLIALAHVSMAAVSDLYSTGKAALMMRFPCETWRSYPVLRWTRLCEPCILARNLGSTLYPSYMHSWPQVGPREKSPPLCPLRSSAPKSVRIEKRAAAADFESLNNGSFLLLEKLVVEICPC